MGLIPHCDSGVWAAGFGEGKRAAQRRRPEVWREGMIPFPPSSPSSRGTAAADGAADGPDFRSLILTAPLQTGYNCTWSADVAQPVEQAPCKREVAGSNPAVGLTGAGTQVANGAWL